MERLWNEVVVAYQKQYTAFLSVECENPGKTLITIVSIPLVACMGEKRNAYRFLMGKLGEEVTRKT
jgi:hypothetical protein